MRIFTVGRDDVGAVGLHHHPVFDFKDLHPGVTPDEFRQEAFVIRGQVLHQHKGHARIGGGGHPGEKDFKRHQPASGRADADDGKLAAVPAESGAASVWASPGATAGFVLSFLLAVMRISAAARLMGAQSGLFMNYRTGGIDPLRLENSSYLCASEQTRVPEYCRVSRISA